MWPNDSVGLSGYMVYLSSIGVEPLHQRVETAIVALRSSSCFTQGHQPIHNNRLTNVCLPGDTGERRAYTVTVRTVRHTG